MRVRASILATIAILAMTQCAFGGFITLSYKAPGVYEGCVPVQVETNFDLMLSASIDPLVSDGSWSTSLAPADMDVPGGSATVCVTVSDLPAVNYVGQGTQTFAYVALRVVPRELPTDQPPYILDPPYRASIDENYVIIGQWPFADDGYSPYPQQAGELAVLIDFTEPATVPAPSALLLATLGAAMVRSTLRKIRA